ncbi:MAG: hypothetical protein LBR64_08010 [Dysgonamonadaceae bacterium]|jgi:hypothetical protein|nr:hypothetical protein [Dysgonamonadaceae bacterium]
MKSIKNISCILFALLAMTGFYACEEEAPYTPAEALNTAQVYFPSTNAATINLSSLEHSFQIAIARVKTDDAITVPLTVSGGDGLYSIPTSVAFAQGQSATSITVGYDPDAVGFDTYSELKLSIGGDGYTSPYGLTEYTVSVGIPAPWVSLGMATYVEAFFSALYGVDDLQYQVEIQENQLTPGLFRLVNPYGAAYEYNDPGDWDDSRDWYLEIHAEDPTAVWIAVQDIGVNWGYGMIKVGSLAGYYIARGETLESQKAAGNTGTFENGIIRFPASTLLFGMANYNSGSLYLGNKNESFRVAMPGVVLADYSLEIAYAGKYTDAKGVDTGVLGQITAVGGDVESVRLAVVEGTDVDAAAEGIKDGSIESIEVPAAESTNLVPFAAAPVAGKYTIVAVAYGGGEAQTVASAELKYTPATGETWTAVSTGTYEYSLIFSGPDPGLTLYQSDADPTRWKIENWCYGVDFAFTYNKTTGEVLVDDQETGYVHSSYGSVYIDDLVDYTGGTSRGQSYYKDGVFYFAVIYYVSAGYFGYGYETFTITGSPIAAPKADFRAGSQKTFKGSTLSHKEFLRRTIPANFLR